MKSLTLKDLREELKIAFKENNDFIFKYIKGNNNVLIKRIDSTIHKRLSEASDAILQTIDTNHNEANQKFNKLSKDVRDVKQDIRFLHQDFKDLETELSNKPSKKQFEEFKSKFDNYPTV